MGADNNADGEDEGLIADRSDKFVWQEGDVKISQCVFCVHYRPGVPPACNAFLEGIPRPIMRNEYDHRQAYPGDHGIRFEAREGTMWEDTGVK